MDRYSNIKEELKAIDLVDLFKNTETLEEILGDSIKGLSLYKDIKDFPSKLLCRKIEKFLEGAISIEGEYREKFIIKFKKEIQNNTVRILNIIDKVEDESKVDYINNIFESLVKEEIDFNMFFRLCKCIEFCIKEDIETLGEYTERKSVGKHSISSQILVDNGLLTEYRIQLADGNAKGTLEGLILSELGEYMYKYGLKMK